MEHRFSLTGRWKGGLNGGGHITVGSLDSEVSVPVALDGPGKGTNPEELLTGAAATCYMITLAAVLERRKLTIDSFTLNSEGYVSTQSGLRFTKIIHRPRIKLHAPASDEDKKTAHDACFRAEKACIITKALSGNVEIIVEPTIE